jgi:hypothetical protein
MQWMKVVIEKMMGCGSDIKGECVNSNFLSRRDLDLVATLDIKLQTQSPIRNISYSMCERAMCADN